MVWVMTVIASLFSEELGAVIQIDAEDVDKADIIMAKHDLALLHMLLANQTKRTLLAFHITKKLFMRKRGLSF